MANTADKPGVRAARRDRLLAAAQGVFSLVGLRAATMEGIASAAGISKATLYAYFPDKDAVFEAVARRLGDLMLGRALSALLDDGELSGRLQRALMAKHGPAYDIVVGSAHAAELLAQRDGIAGEVFRNVDAAIEDAMAKAMAEAGIQDGPRRARVLFDAAIGIGERAHSRKEMEEDLAWLVVVSVNVV